MARFHYSGRSFQDVPDLKKNLFSEGKLTLNMETKKSRNRAQIYKNGKLIAWGKRQSNNLYKMLFKTVISEEAQQLNQVSRYGTRDLAI